MTFHDFFHDIFQFSMILGLAVTFENFQNYPCFRVFFLSNPVQKTQTPVSIQMRVIRVVQLSSILHCYSR